MTAMRLTMPALAKMAREGEKIAMLTCYDASFATLEEAAGVDVILVGDSLGMVVQGHDSTLPVTLDQLIYHTHCVARGSERALVIGDLPFASYQESPEQAYRSASAVMAAGAQMVKLEGGHWLLPTVKFLTQRGIPVCGHLGLQPQSVHALGGYRVQGKTPESAQAMLDDARALVDAGIGLLVLEAVPADLATRLTQAITVPTIGIGAGPGCSGQVLVIYDMLGIYPGKPARFVRNFMTGSASVGEAVGAYVKAVKDGSFPAPEHCF
jgi:3-methyl-2-oxobutanoate hydroxymethyltransferase